jgi:hypothetical protein
MAGVFVGYLIPCPFHDWEPHRIMEMRWSPRVARYLGRGESDWTSGRLEDVALECGAHFDPLSWLMWSRWDHDILCVKVTSNPPVGDEPEIELYRGSDRAYQARRRSV